MFRSVERRSTRRVLLALFVLLGSPRIGVAQAAAPGITVEESIVYASHQGSALLADIAYPSSVDDLKPAIIYVHGGRWRAGSRNGNGALDVREWAGLGYFAVTIDYRLVETSPAPVPYQDTLASIRWVHAHAGEYGVDPDRIYLIGNSAGGHLVALVATLGDGPYPRIGGWEEARSDVRAAISVAGTYDLNTLSWGDLWTPIGEDPGRARQLASPMHQISENTKPILVIHSDDDQSVPVHQAVDMVDALADARIHHGFVHWEDRGHMGITKDVADAARAFIAEVEGHP